MCVPGSDFSDFTFFHYLFCFCPGDLSSKSQPLGGAHEPPNMPYQSCECPCTVCFLLPFSSSAAMAAPFKVELQAPHWHHSVQLFVGLALTAGSLAFILLGNLGEAPYVYHAEVLPVARAQVQGYVLGQGVCQLSLMACSMQQRPQHHHQKQTGGPHECPPSLLPKN